MRTKRAYIEMCTLLHLADHFEQLAQQYVRQAARASEEFWMTIRRMHKMPEGADGIQLSPDRLRIQFIQRGGEMFKQFLIQPRREANVEFIKQGEQPENKK